MQLSYLLPLLILSADAPARTAGVFPRADEVWGWNFEQQDDKNYDGWPDDWTRRKGKGYPLYLDVAIADDPAPRPNSKRALRFELDGSAALVYSSRVKVSPLYSYVLSGHIKTEQLKHDVAFATLLFYDKNGELIESRESKHHTGSTGWTPFQVGPITPATNDVHEAVVALHLKPVNPDGDADLVGAAMFDDLSIGSLPRVSLEMNSPHHVYADLNEPKITCRASGISDPNPLVRFELVDVDGNRLLQEEVQMKAEASRPQLGRAFSGAATWKPEIPNFGFYHLRVSIAGHTNEPISTTLAMLQDFPHDKTGEFGWTLPQGDRPLSLKTLASFLGQVGIHWVKFPVWYGDADVGRADQLAWFAERMSSHHINMVGLLDIAPKEVRQLFGNKEELPVATIFVEPAVWKPAVDPVMTRLSLKVRWWQLGTDGDTTFVNGDTSFVNFPDLQKTLGEILEGFNRFGQRINLGVPWRSVDETPAAHAPPWAFLSYVADPPLTADELSRYMPRQGASTAKLWLILKPLPKTEYSLETRVRDLVARMLSAKTERVDGVFVPNPFDSESGLMNKDGTPGKMLLPWRTTAMMTSGAQSLGSITLPNGSSNQIFVKGNQAVMVVWNDAPTRETIYLGPYVEVTDVWGRKTKPSEVTDNDFVRQQLEVGRLPIFVTGVDPSIARWRMSFRFEQERVASVFGREQAVYYSFANSFEQGVGGSIQLHTPKVWQAAPTNVFFKLAANDDQRRRLDVTLEPETSAGPQPIRVDFELTAARTHKFSIYRTMHVGLGDIVVEATTRLDEHGNLVVEQQLVNNTDRFVSFNCLLSTNKRRRERRQIFNRGRGATAIVFIFPNGKDLIGDTFWLRVEEIDGPRILNHQVIAHP